MSAVRRRSSGVGKQVFAPLKSDKIHDVPLTDDVVVMRSECMRTWPPEMVTLPWIKAGGSPVTFRLLSRPYGLCAVVSPAVGVARFRPTGQVTPVPWSGQ
jgi:hypothetical protein